jgi:predicted alpha/beta-fold hydrolase
LFTPAFGLKSSHFQTIYSSLFRKLPNLSFEIEKFTLRDGDFLECYWHKTANHITNTSIVILFHGLAGSYKSPYIQGAMQALCAAGFSTVLMHFRSCSGVDNLLPCSYHSGETNDANEYITNITTRYPNAKIFAVGYSLGANMLLKLLGEKADKNYLSAAIAISPPMKLDVCTNRMNHGFSRYYQHRLVKDLNKALDKKYDKHDMQKLLGLSRKKIKSLKTFWEFDEAYTAPIHGFASAQEYYTQCSSKQFLKYIQTPTLIIHAKDDPFMTMEVLPTKEECSENISMELYENGGHVGFISGSFFRPEYWLEKRVVDYLLSIK